MSTNAQDVAVEEKTTLYLHDVINVQELPFEMETLVKISLETFLYMRIIYICSMHHLLNARQLSDKCGEMGAPFYECLKVCLQHFQNTALVILTLYRNARTHMFRYP